MTVMKYKKFWAQRLPSSVTRDSAFTLIELLVVVAIIAILSGMLLPGLSKAKGAAQKVKCISQLGQLNLASQLYRDDSNGALPTRTDGMTALGGRVPASWPGTLFPYFQSTNTLRCPTDKANALTGIQPHPVDRVVLGRELLADVPEPGSHSSLDPVPGDCISDLLAGCDAQARTFHLAEEIRSPRCQ